LESKVIKRSDEAYLEQARTYQDQRLDPLESKVRERKRESSEGRRGERQRRSETEQAKREVDGRSEPESKGVAKRMSKERKLLKE
jgi:hypothetical protein